MSYQTRGRGAVVVMALGLATMTLSIAAQAPPAQGRGGAPAQGRERAAARTRWRNHGRRTERPASRGFRGCVSGQDPLSRRSAAPVTALKRAARQRAPTS